MSDSLWPHGTVTHQAPWDFPGKNTGVSAISFSRGSFRPRDQTCLVRAMVSPAIMCKYESRIIKKAECWRIDAFKLWCWRRLESPLDSKENKPVNPKGNQPWTFIGRTDTEAEAPVLWSLDTNSWLIGKDPDAGKDWRQEEKGMTADEMVR